MRARVRACAPSRAPTCGRAREGTVPMRDNAPTTRRNLAGRQNPGFVPLSRNPCKSLKSQDLGFWGVRDSSVPAFCKSLKSLRDSTKTYCPLHHRPRTQEACERGLAGFSGAFDGAKAAHSFLSGCTGMPLSNCSRYSFMALGSPIESSSAHSSTASRRIFHTRTLFDSTVAR